MNSDTVCVFVSNYSNAVLAVADNEDDICRLVQEYKALDVEFSVTFLTMNKMRQF